MFHHRQHHRRYLDHRGGSQDAQEGRGAANDEAGVDLDGDEKGGEAQKGQGRAVGHGFQPGKL